MNPIVFTQPTFVSGGNISPRRFLTLSTSVAGTAIQASNQNQLLIGVSEQWTRYTPGSPSDDGYIAISGEQVPYRGPMQIASLQLGASVTNPRVPLTTDANGKGTPVAPADGTTVYYGALALELGAADEFIKVYVLSPAPTV